MEVGSIRRRSKSASCRANALASEEFMTSLPCAGRCGPGIAESIARVPKSTGGSTANLPAESLAIKGKVLSGHRTSRGAAFAVPASIQRYVRRFGSRNTECHRMVRVNLG
jgi:hypothetical protein